MAYKPLKLWFDQEMALLLIQKLKEVNASFDESQFIKQSQDSYLINKELKDRVSYFADVLERTIHGTFKEKARLLAKVLGPENDLEEGMFKTYYWIMPIAKWVETYGLEDFDANLREVMKRAGCKKEKITFIFDESNVLGVAFLERMHGTLALMPHCLQFQSVGSSLASF